MPKLAKDQKLPAWPEVARKNPRVLRLKHIFASLVSISSEARVTVTKSVPLFIIWKLSPENSGADYDIYHDVEERNSNLAEVIWNSCLNWYPNNFISKQLLDFSSTNWNFEREFVSLALKGSNFQDIWLDQKQKLLSRVSLVPCDHFDVISAFILNAKNEHR